MPGVTEPVPSGSNTESSLAGRRQVAPAEASPAPPSEYNPN